MRLADKIALVTGAGSGFGEGIARRFAEEGASVVVNDVTGAAAQRVAKDIVAAGGKASPAAADVTVNDEVAAMIRTAVETYGRLDVLVNNAGVPQRA